MNAINRIIQKRNEFMMKWKMPPDIVEVPDDIYMEICNLSIQFGITGDYICGARVEVGKELTCRFDVEIVKC